MLGIMDIRMVIRVVAGREAVVFIDLDCAVTAGFSLEKIEVP